MSLPRSAVVIANEIRLKRSQHQGVFVVVEGRADRLFYERLLDSQRCKFVTADGKEKLCEVMRILDADGFHGVLGIIDPDFDLLEGTPTSSPNIVRGDCHDIEAMLVRSPAFDKVLREFGSEDKIGKLITRTGTDIRSVLLAAASPLGYLRWYSQRSALQLRFEELQFAGFIDTRTLTVNRSALITTVKNNSQRHDLDADELGLAIRKMEDLKPDPWHLCNGHDLVSVVSFGLRRAIGSRASRVVATEELERALRLAYEAVDFVASEIFQAIQEWEKRNSPFRVLR